MPNKPFRPCSKVGCARITRERYCDDHKHEYFVYDKYRENAAKRGYGNQWRKARASYLSKHTFCIKCGELATVVDHIIPHRGDMNLFWSIRNWQPLCKTCHNRKTATEDGGFGR